MQFFLSFYHNSTHSTVLVCVCVFVSSLLSSFSSFFCFFFPPFFLCLFYFFRWLALGIARHLCSITQVFHLRFPIAWWNATTACYKSSKDSVYLFVVIHLTYTTNEVEIKIKGSTCKHTNTILWMRCNATNIIAICNQQPYPALCMGMCLVRVLEGKLGLLCLPN